MPEETQRLRHAVSELHDALKTARDLDPESRELLQQTLDDVHQVLERATASESRPSIVVSSELPLRRQLTEAAAEFEGSHPKLAGTIRSLIDALAQIGI